MAATAFVIMNSNKVKVNLIIDLNLHIMYRTKHLQISELIIEPRLDLSRSLKALVNRRVLLLAHDFNLKLQVVRKVESSISDHQHVLAILQNITHIGCDFDLHSVWMEY